MKTVFENAATESFELAKRTLYAFEVLIIGIFIPVLFLVGINTNYGDKFESDTSVSKPHVKPAQKATAETVNFLSDQHS